MKKSSKIWLITAAFLVAAGLLMFTGVMIKYNWDFTKLSTVKYETETAEIGESFENISVNTDVFDISFAVSDGNTCRVTAAKPENTEFIAVSDGDTLNIKTKYKRKWYEHIGMDLGKSEITVYLPKREYGTLSVKENTGDISVPKGFIFEEAEIELTTGDIGFASSVKRDIKTKTTTGDVEFDGVKCRNIVSKGSTGEVTFKNTVAAGNITVKRSTGDVRFDGSDAAGIFAETGTGDVTGTLLSQKEFIAETSTGDISVPESRAGGRCEITTSTGDIHIEIGGKTVIVK